MRLHDRAGFQCRGELHRIIPPEAVTLSQFDGTVDDRTVYRNKRKVVFAILQETAQHAITLFQRDPLGRPVFGC